MSYIYEQKIKNHIYFYEITSYWDPVKKQSRQKRKYIGKKDPSTGKSITPRKSNTPKTCLDYGSVYLLKQIAERIKLTKCLKDSFPDIWENILSLAIFKICSDSQFYLFNSWCESNPVANNLSSQDISKLLAKIEQYEPTFIKAWNKIHAKKEAIFFDLTSISTYSNLINFAEWGYNRDKERLTQINLGMLYSSITEYPLAYSIYPGSIADVKTLRNLIILSKEWGISKLLFVLDCGFYSKTNIEEMLDKSINFILRLNPSTNNYKTLVSSFKMSSKTFFNLNKEGYYYNVNEIKIGNKKVVSYTYHCDTKKAFQFNLFSQLLSDFERMVTEKKLASKRKLADLLEDQGLTKFYSITQNNSLRRNIQAIDNHINTMGKFVLVAANENLTSQQVLEHYRNRDQAEKGFDSFKSEIGADRLRTKSDKTMLGSLFISFISLILYTHMIKTVRNSSFTVPQILSSLKNLKAFKLTDGKLLLSEISKKHSDIFKLFKIPKPTFPSYNLGGF